MSFMINYRHEIICINVLIFLSFANSLVMTYKLNYYTGEDVISSCNLLLIRYIQSNKIVIVLGRYNNIDHIQYLGLKLRKLP